MGDASTSETIKGCGHQPVTGGTWPAGGLMTQASRSHT